MFKVLVVFFILNLLYSIWKFKVLVNPATLFGLGFAIAGVMCLNYYDVWVLDRFRADTFWFLFLGTILFTFTCAILCPTKRDYISKENIENVPITNIYTPVLFNLLLMAIALQLFVCYYKYKMMTNVYGGFWGFSELVYIAHVDAHDGEQIYSWWFSQFNGISANIAPFIYLITGVLLAKGELKGKMLYFTIFYLLLTFLDSALGGGKGGAIQGVIMLILAWFIKYIRVRHKLCIPKKALAVIGAMGVAVFLGINIMNYAVGRGNEDNSMDVAMYAGAVYCGAELKNMDIFMHRPYRATYFGQNTFRRLYTMLDKRGLIKGYKEKRFEGNTMKPFLSVNGYNLGNVYTLFCDLY